MAVAGNASLAVWRSAMRAGGDDSSFFGNSVLAVFAIVLACYLGWAVDHSSKSGNISYSYVAAVK